MNELGQKDIATEDLYEVEVEEKEKEKEKEE